MALGGLALYAFFAPASIAAAWIAISIAALGWLARTLLTRRARLRRTPIDLPLWLFFAWTLLSSLVSEEPAISLAKLPSAATFLFLYLVAAIIGTRREAVALACVLLVGASACTLWGVFELARGRGVIIEEIAAGSPLRAEPGLRVGDCVWRINGQRVGSVSAINEAIRRAPVGSRLRLSVIAEGEHVEREGPVVTDELKSAASPSGIAGTHPTHRFRASGWTRHYETFAETAQLAAQLALGCALAHLARRRSAQKGRTRRARAALFAAAFGLLACGVALTAMRTATIALVVGALTTAWRASVASRRARAAVALALTIAVALGVFAVWRTRDAGALSLSDPSARLRLEVARVAARRVAAHPVFGHGMDAVHLHWNEWGFPGKDLLHAHSTPVQLAFDRGLPALLLWLWLLLAFWFALARAERRFRASDEAGAHGLLLGAVGATAGFFASSLVNYNFGDAEVALMLWWLMGSVFALMRRGENREAGRLDEALQAAH